MSLTIRWQDVLLRLALSVVAGAIIGLNRSERGHAAGLRTTTLVSLAAAAAMIQVNLLLSLSKEKQSLVELDLMRLPLGILSGMGFIGGGAILKRGEMVHGVTTAATLWFVTVMGLCLGGGQIALGLELLLVGLFVLSTLRAVERRFIDEHRATVTLALAEDGPSDEAVRGVLTRSGFAVARCAVENDRAAATRFVELDLRWRGGEGGQGDGPPPVVDELAQRPGVRKLRWDPKT